MNPPIWPVVATMRNVTLTLPGVFEERPKAFAGIPSDSLFIEWEALRRAHPEDVSRWIGRWLEPFASDEALSLLPEGAGRMFLMWSDAYLERLVCEVLPTEGLSLKWIMPTPLIVG